MLLHSQPLLRARELALKANGLILNIESVGVTRLKNAETAGIRPSFASVMAVPSKVPFFWFRGSKIDPSA